MLRWSAKPSSPGWWLSYPGLVGQIALLGAGGHPCEEISQAPGVLSGAVPPTWDRSAPDENGPTLLFTNGASLNSYVTFGAIGAFKDLGVSTGMTLIARVCWTGGQGGILERLGADIGWSWAVSNPAFSGNRPSFTKRQSAGAKTAKESNVRLVSGAWTTIAVTYDPAGNATNGGNIEHYVAGVQTSAANVWSGTNTNTSDASASLILGNASIDMPGGIGSQGAFGGNIAWLFGFDRVLAAAEIAEWSQ